MPFREDEKFPACFLADNKKGAEKLYKKYKRLISHLAFQYSRKSGVSAEDLFSEGLIGLARAARDFNPNRKHCTRCNRVEGKCECDSPKFIPTKSKFHSFAVLCIKYALRQGIYLHETPVKIPEHVKESNYYYTRMLQALEASELHHEVKERLIEDYNFTAEAAGVVGPYAKLVNTNKLRIRNRARAHELSYNELLDLARKMPRRSFTDIHRPEFSGASEGFDDERLDKESSLIRIQDVLDSESYDILIRFSVDGERVDSIATDYNVTPGRISQIVKAARDLLKQREKYVIHGDSLRKR